MGTRRRTESPQANTTYGGYAHGRPELRDSLGTGNSGFIWDHDGQPRAISDLQAQGVNLAAFGITPDIGTSRQPPLLGQTGIPAGRRVQTAAHLTPFAGV